MQNKKANLVKEAENETKLHIDKALKFFEQKKFEEAVEEYTLAINLSEDKDKPKPKFHFLRGHCYRAQKQWEMCIVDYTAAIDAEPIANYLLFRGIVFRTVKQLERSLLDFERGIDLDNQNGTLFLQRGLTLYELGKKKEAIEDYTNAIKLTKKPKHIFKPYFHRGNTLRECGFIEESINDLSKAAELDPLFVYFIFFYFFKFIFFF
jgi:tetratricopeptide (TPR) repeat protein